MRGNARVYVMAGSDGLLKIGHSRDPNVRKWHVTTPAQGKAALVYQTDELLHAEAIEKAAQGILRVAGRHVRGEWFHVELDEAIKAIEAAKGVVAETYPLEPSPQLERMNFTIGEDAFSMLDDLRRAEPDLPSRSEMIRRLIQRAAAAAKPKK